MCFDIYNVYHFFRGVHLFVPMKVFPLTALFTYLTRPPTIAHPCHPAGTLAPQSTVPAAKQQNQPRHKAAALRDKLAPRFIYELPPSYKEVT
jgi:hypothetical protein